MSTCTPKKKKSYANMRLDFTGWLQATHGMWQQKEDETCKEDECHNIFGRFHNEKQLKFLLKMLRSYH